MKTIEEAANDLLVKCKEATAIKGGVLEVNVEKDRIVAVLSVAQGGYCLPWVIKDDIRKNILMPACRDYPLVVKINPKSSFGPEDQPY